MAMFCAFPNCRHRATRWEKIDVLPMFGETHVPCEATVRPFCDYHCGEDESHDHVASEGDPKICGRCGIHIDSLRP